ncbi:MAG: hypothetical protein Q8P67_22165 [archaeon]|nr:hypothetical protein [archaeon]
MGAVLLISSLGTGHGYTLSNSSEIANVLQSIVIHIPTISKVQEGDNITITGLTCCMFHQQSNTSTHLFTISVFFILFFLTFFFFFFFNNKKKMEFMWPPFR